MTRVVRGRPTTSSSPLIKVAGLPPGRHRFQLVVIGANRHRSHPDVVEVLVLPPQSSSRSIDTATTTARKRG